MYRAHLSVLFVVGGAFLHLTPALAESRMELELGMELAYAESGAPAASVRAGLQLFDILRPGLRAQAILGPRGARTPGGFISGSGGYRAWSFTPELQLST